MRCVFTVAALLLASSAAFAEEPVGCDKFKWPVDRERAALAASNIAQLQSGADLPTPPASAMISLRPLTDANLPKKPEREQKPETFAGFVKLPSLPAGIYTVSLSEGAWIDAIQSDAYLRPRAFSGATGCEGIRKTMKFELSEAPLLLQISGVPKNTIHLAILPAAN